jgi:hypothetical protein
MVPAESLPPRSRPILDSDMTNEQIGDLWIIGQLLSGYARSGEYAQIWIMSYFIGSRTFLDNLLSVNRRVPSWGNCHSAYTCGDPQR